MITPFYQSIKGLLKTTESPDTLLIYGEIILVTEIPVEESTSVLSHWADAYKRISKDHTKLCRMNSSVRARLGL